MDCPNCEDGYMDKDSIFDFEVEGSGRVLITWEAHCPECGYECCIEEEFESTGYEKEV